LDKKSLLQQLAEECGVSVDRLSEVATNRARTDADREVLAKALLAFARQMSLDFISVFGKYSNPVPVPWDCILGALQEAYDQGIEHDLDDDQLGPIHALLTSLKIMKKAEDELEAYHKSLTPAFKPWQVDKMMRGEKGTKH
jgi:hypothetical protein